MQEKSKFGKGLVICLAKFYQHFADESLRRIYFCKQISDMPETDQEKVMSKNPPDNLNFGKDLNAHYSFWKNKIVPIWGSVEDALSTSITVWANGASDHLYEIETP